STLIVLATVLFIVAFIYEPRMNALETPFSHRAMYSIFAGTLLHVLSGIGKTSRAKEPKPSEN
ncbi:MAG: hypothetical protein M3539_03130, partial [Acidobacteriota bacterium]|nr:hypothetical protein [Acidobacteriota bacterium]